MWDNVIFIIILVICVALSAFFSGSENALAAANKLRIKKEAEKGNKKAKTVEYLQDNYPESISTILVGNNLVNIAASSVTTLLAINLGGNNDTSLTLGTIIITVVILIFGETIPKILSVEHANKFVYFIAKPLRFCLTIFKPLVFVVTKFIDSISKLWTPKEEEVSMTDEELVDIVETIEDSGQFDEDKSDLIISAIELSDIAAYEIMVPRVDVIGIDIDDDIDSIFEDSNIFNYSVVPVYKDSLDDIIGIVKTKDLMKLRLLNKEIDLEKIMKEPEFVHKTKSILDILEEFKETGKFMAVIIDEFGGTMGILTMEDIIEELVGDIWDEKDKIVPDFIQQEENVYDIDGMMNIFDFFELVEYDSKDFESEYTTIGGWCTEMLEDFPEVGEKFSFENMDFEILAMDERRVEKVRVIIHPIVNEEEE